jgi:hypothetical protein
MSRKSIATARSPFSEALYPVGNLGFGIALGDFNGDGKLDVSVTNNASGTVSVLLGNGDGTLQAQMTFRAGSGPGAIALADFAGTGRLYGGS